MNAKRYFDLPEQRRCIEIKADGFMKTVAKELIEAQYKTPMREVDALEYVLLKREYSKPYEPEQQTFL